MRAAARARPVEPEILSPEDARAARIAAETALSAASAAVQSVVDQFPAPQNDRRWIEQERHLVASLEAPLVNFRHASSQALVERFADFDTAVAKETEARRAVDLARADEVEALRAAFGDGRADLAEAIATAAASIEAANAARAVAERARGRLVQARMAHDAAEAALVDAREAAIGAATAEDGVQPPDLKTLRRAVADAADDIDIAGEAARRAEGALIDPEHAERRSIASIEAAARAVLYADFDKRINALDAMVARFKTDALAHAAWLRAAVPSQGVWTPQKAKDLQRADALIRGLVSLGEPIRTTPYEIGDAWFSAALSSLMQDPSAPLPEMPV